MKLFAQLTKVDEEKRLVYGIAAAEVPDHAGEIMDYEGSKPYFAKWSDGVAKDTDGKSLGNVRAMHGKVAAGKLVGIEFDDTSKSIPVCAKVVDDGEWKKVLEGVYTGFSIGGDYVGQKKVEKIDGKEVKRYVANPTEISLVDRPCIPTAKFFEIQKADGSLAKVAFREPEPETAGTVNGTPEEVDELVATMNKMNLSVGDVLATLKKQADDKGKGTGAGLPGGEGDETATHPAEEGEEGEEDEETKKAKKKAEEEAAAKAAKEKEGGEVDKAVTVGALRKGVYDCGSFSGVLSALVNLKRSAEYEALQEGDKSGMPAKIAACIALVGTTFKELIDEIIGEAKMGGEAPPEMLTLSQQAGDLAKTVDNPLQKLAPTAAGAQIDEGALQKMVEAALEARVEPLKKALEEANTKITKLEEQPAPTRVALRAVAKSEDLGSDAEQEALRKAAEAAAPIVDAVGDKHEAAGLIKFLHKQGGVPMAMPAELRK